MAVLPGGALVTDAPGQWHTDAVERVVVAVVALAAIAVVVFLLVTAVIGFRQLRPFLRGQY
jgi:hypothetical protein